MAILLQKPCDFDQIRNIHISVLPQFVFPVANVKTHTTRGYLRVPRAFLQELKSFFGNVNSQINQETLELLEPFILEQHFFQGYGALLDPERGRRYSQFSWCVCRTLELLWQHHQAKVPFKQELETLEPHRQQIRRLTEKLQRLEARAAEQIVAMRREARTVQKVIAELAARSEDKALQQLEVLLHAPLTASQLSSRDVAALRASLPETLKVEIQTMSGNSLTFDLSVTAHVQELKELIQSQEGVPSICQKLLMQDKTLEDSDIIADMCKFGSHPEAITLVISREEAVHQLKTELLLGWRHSNEKVQVACEALEKVATLDLDRLTIGSIGWMQVIGHCFEPEIFVNVCVGLVKAMEANYTDWQVDLNYFSAVFEHLVLRKDFSTQALDLLCHLSSATAQEPALNGVIGAVIKTGLLIGHPEKRLEAAKLIVQMASSPNELPKVFREFLKKRCKLKEVLYSLQCCYSWSRTTWGDDIRFDDDDTIKELADIATDVEFSRIAVSTLVLIAGPTQKSFLFQELAGIVRQKYFVHPDDYIKKHSERASPLSILVRLLARIASDDELMVLDEFVTRAFQLLSQMRRSSCLKILLALCDAGRSNLIKADMLLLCLEDRDLETRLQAVQLARSIMMSNSSWNCKDQILAVLKDLSEADWPCVRLAAVEALATL
eukprot:TRINITY_DN82135_c0_g1_i1.p1 TRINITY_DN82135_c0_g1~~TRINITY_DN82135_c0_g1_i1.p1  ORF type:complete len:733 (+),score=124.19 TRINITY_DN82135_c0_g1_i1:203-2200(+)